MQRKSSRPGAAHLWSTWPETMQSPSRARSSSTTPILDKYRNDKKTDSTQDASILIEDERRNDSAELQCITAAPMPAGTARSWNVRDTGYEMILERKLIKSQRKLELATFRLNNVHAAGGNIKQLTAQLGSVIAELGAFLSIADPAQLLDHVMSPATVRARSAYLQNLKNFEATVKAGYAKHGWNLAAGGVGNLVSFGIGGVISALTANPWIGLAVNTTLWTFAEPLVSMMRATTFTNPYLDLYMVRQRLQARAVREALEGTSGLDRNCKFAWPNPDSNDIEWLNAADWLARSSWLTLWAGKHLTDDVPCHVYSVVYSITNCLPEFTYRDLYDAGSQGKWTRTGIRTVAGMAAGAALQECVQLLRAWQAEQTGGKEVVTKTTALWKEEAAVIAMVLNDIDTRCGVPGLAEEKKQAYAMLKDSFSLSQQKALAKSMVLSSILYEWRAMLQSKREAVGIDPEVPGKTLYTAASFIGKGLAQLPGIGAAQLGALAVKSPTPWIRWAGYLVPPFALIGAAGFVVRRELEVIAHAMLGAVHGLGRRCCPHEAED